MNPTEEQNEALETIRVALVECRKARIEQGFVFSETEKMAAADIALKALRNSLQSSWQPIETAPIDTLCLFACVVGNGVWHETASISETYKNDHCVYTHWMHLPPVTKGAE